MKDETLTNKIEKYNVERNIYLITVSNPLLKIPKFLPFQAKNRNKKNKEILRK